MYRKIAEKITSSLVKSDVIDREERSIYEYSIEVMISDFIYFFIAILTAVFTKTVIETILFYIGFFSIRKYAGGYHADSYWKCHLLFLANQLAMILFQYILPQASLPYVIIIIIFLSVVCVFSFAPVANENREFTEHECKKFALYSKTISALTAIGICVLIFLNVQQKLIFVYSFGMFSVSISLVAENIKIKRKVYHNEKDKRTY